jgi:ribonuclease HI
MALFTISAAALIDTALRHGGAGLDVEAEAPGADTRDAMALESATDANATLLMLLRGLNHIAPLCAAGDTVHIAVHRGEALLDASRTGITDDDRLAFQTLTAIDRSLEFLERIGVDIAWLAPDSNHAGLARADTLAARIYERALATAAAAAA